MNNYIKRVVRYGLIHGLLFMVFMTAISYWIRGKDFLLALTVGLAGGILVGLANSLLIFKFSVPKYILDAVSVDLDIDETIIFQTAATCTSGQEPAAGKLFLTNKRLIFKNYRKDEKPAQFFIDLTDIFKVSRFTTFFIFKNGLKVQTASVTHQFIVDRLNEWIFQLDLPNRDLQNGNSELSKNYTQ